MRLLKIAKIANASRCASSSSAVQLSYARYGADSDRQTHPLVIAHGLFGQKSNWNSVAKALQRKLGNQIFAVDLRNHGQSPWTSTMTYDDMALDLAHFVREVVAPQSGFKSASLLGHSMGGKMAMVFALTHSDLLHKLIIEDVAPKIYDSQWHSDFPEYITAMKKATEVSRTFDNSAEARKTIDSELKSVVKETAVRQFLLTNLYLKSDGSAAWRLNLDALMVYLNEIVAFSLVENIASSFSGTTLFLSGSKSPYVTEDDHPQIKKIFPNVVFDVIPSAGHWVHADRPQDFIASVHKFLS